MLTITKANRRRFLVPIGLAAFGMSFAPLNSSVMAQALYAGAVVASQSPTTAPTALSFSPGPQPVISLQAPPVPTALPAMVPPKAAAAEAAMPSREDGE